MSLWQAILLVSIIYVVAMIAIGIKFYFAFKKAKTAMHAETTTETDTDPTEETTEEAPPEDQITT